MYICIYVMFVLHIKQTVKLQFGNRIRRRSVQLENQGASFAKTSLYRTVCLRLQQTARSMPVSLVQKPAPDFAGTAVVNGEFKDIKLSDYKGKYVVFFFYPLDL